MDNGVEVECGNTFCNAIWITLLFVLFLTIYKTRELPSIHVEEFYVPAFNSTANFTTPNNTIYINLRLKNRNPVTGLYYDDPLYLNLSYIPKDQNRSISLGEYGLHGFYQGNGKTKHVKGLLLTHELSLGARAASNVTANRVREDPPVEIFRVDFFGKVRYKLIGYHQRHPMLLGTNVEVHGETGEKIGNKGIRLVKSSAWYHNPPVALLLISIMFCIIFI